MYTSIRITALTRRPRPRLLVMVPFRDQLELTLRCLESIEGQQHDLDVKNLLINNGSEDPATVRGLAEWLDHPRRHHSEVVDHAGAFNYARMHNMAVDRHGKDRDLLLFLNNDVELISSDCLQTLAMHLLGNQECAFAGIRLEYPEDGGIQHGGIKIHESNLTCGCPSFLHAGEVTDYVREERVVFGVTFACAMVRREVFDHLGGLDEVVLPNAYGDVDIEARALAMGYKNFYFGTLVGTHHESKSRGRTSEEYEFLALHARHAQVISDWKLRGFTLSLQSWTSPVAPAPASEETPELEPEPSPGPIRPDAPAPAPIPLRYKVADRLNHALKLILGPAHSVLKTLILRSRQRLRVKSSPVIEALPMRPGPHFPMDRDGAAEGSRAGQSSRI
jgi:hypothetical protein